MEEVLVTPARESDLGHAFFRAIDERFTGPVNRPRPDFAFVISTRQPTCHVISPYAGSKAALAKHGIPSQYVSHELLDASYQFKYAASNIALSFFVKLGGIPWSLYLERKAPSLVLGIGRADLKSKDNRGSALIGFAICTLSDGIYLNTSFFPPAQDYEQFLQNLRDGLRQALDHVLSKQQTVEKVSIHISRFERRETMKAVREALTDYKTSQQEPVPFEMVRLTEESDFSVMDLSHPDYVSEEGTVVALGPRHALIVVEGRKEKAVWRMRKPVTLELHREYSSSPSVDFRDAVEEAFYLSTVNWRGFNAVTQPISLRYAKLLAYQMAEISAIDANICTDIQSHVNLNSVPWFI